MFVFVKWPPFVRATASQPWFAPGLMTTKEMGCQGLWEVSTTEYSHETRTAQAAMPFLDQRMKLSGFDNLNPLNSTFTFLDVHMIPLARGSKNTEIVVAVVNIENVCRDDSLSPVLSYAGA